MIAFFRRGGEIRLFGVTGVVVEGAAGGQNPVRVAMYGMGVLMVRSGVTAAIFALVGVRRYRVREMALSVALSVPSCLCDCVCVRVFACIYVRTRPT